MGFGNQENGPDMMNNVINNPNILTPPNTQGFISNNV
jgi:hypothetical protein